MVERSHNGLQPVLKVHMHLDGEHAAQAAAWREQAERAWFQPGHPGWTLVTECIVSVCALLRAQPVQLVS